MRITFARHGESESNVAGRWQGHGDSQLSHDGRRQARALATRLSWDRPDFVVSSDLARALDTARAVSDAVELDPAFREVDVGDWEGLTRPEVAARFPEQTRALATGATDVKIGGAESWADLDARADAAFEALVARARARGAEHVLVVTHGGVLASLFAGLLGVRHKYPRVLGRLGNTALASVSVSDGTVTVDRWNDATHIVSPGEWAAERQVRGAAVFALVAHAASDDEGPAPSGGRLRAGPATLALERLGSSVRGVARMYAPKDPVLRNAAAMLAGRSDAQVADEPVVDGLDRTLAELATRHGGSRVGVVVPAREIAEVAAGAIAAKGRAKLAPPPHASVTHIVSVDGVLALADYAAAHVSGDDQAREPA